MQRREFIGIAAAAPAAVLAAPARRSAPKSSGYVDVNGLQMYYERHGSGGVPLVLLHGAFSATGSSFGPLLPGLSAKREVISFELQGHGHTADIDRPMSYSAMASDVAAALNSLKIPVADVFGYSLGARVGLHIGLEHSQKVRKLVLLSVTYRRDGIQPGLMDSLAKIQPSAMRGTPWYKEYVSIAPRPQDFDRLWAKKTEMDLKQTDIPDEQIRSLKPPILLISGDSDIATLEHTVKFFRLLGGGVFGDTPAGLPRSRLAILPATSHVSAPQQAKVLLDIVPPFLDG